MPRTVERQIVLVGEKEVTLLSDMPREMQNEVGRFWLDEEGLLRCVANETSQTAEQARDSMRIFRELAQGQRRVAVIDTSRNKGLSRAARNCYAGPESSDLWQAVALVVASSVVATSVANFVISVTKPVVPLRLFESEAEALAWARGQRSGSTSKAGR